MRRSGRILILGGICTAWILSAIAAGCQSYPATEGYPGKQGCGCESCGSCKSGCKSCGGGPSGADVGGGSPSCNCSDAGGHGSIPRELNKVTLPDYIIEPPDIVVLNTVHGTPMPPYRLEPLDQLQIQVPDALPNEPIAGIFAIDPDGTINMGLSYGSIRIAGLTLDQARVVITNHLKRILKDPKPVVALAQSRALATVVQGAHLVRMDGTIGLGAFGDLYATGMTRMQLKVAIERRLSQYLLNPQVTVDVLGYNSKVFYVIFDGGGYGQQSYRLPITGNETVLDAITGLNGLPPVSSTKKIWVARPNPCDRACAQVLPVDWKAISEGGSVATNYQLMPGDRIFVHADPLICLDQNVAKILQPLERVMGFTLLTTSVIQSVQSIKNGGNNNGNGTAFVGVVR
jgi:polysaccharide biosynthesis/export protein